jgi:HEAT repeat protein
MNLIRHNAASNKLAEIERLADDKPAHLPRLLKLSRDSDPEIRWRALELLADVDDPKAAKRLTDGLSDSDEIVRLECIDAVATTGNQSAVPLLCTLLDDPDPLVRREAAFALGRLGDVHSVLDLEKRASRSSKMERVGIYAGLVCLGRQQYLASLLDLTSSASYRVRSAATNTLADISASLTPQARESIVAKLNSALTREKANAVRSAIETALRSIAAA